METGAGPNFFRRIYLPIIDVHINLGVEPTISDSNSCILNIVGTTVLYVRFRTSVVKCHLYIFEMLSNAYVLGSDFFDRFVEATKST